MAFVQPALPYALSALAPYLGEEQLMYHSTKHHAAYFTNLNKLVEGKPEAALSLEQVIAQAGPGPMFNNAAQALNHTLYFQSMLPAKDFAPVSGALAAAIARDFGSQAAFQDAFGKAAVGVFGSGWCYLAADKAGKLSILPLPNADTPMKHGQTAVLTLDVWEHAYYIDYRNLRPKFVEGFWSVANWAFAGQQYAGVGK